MNITKAPCIISRNLNLSNGKYNVSESEVCEVKGGVFKDCKYAWTSCKTELRLFRMSVGNKIATWRFGGDVSQSESVGQELVGYRVTCVCELPAWGAVTGSAAPQLLVGLDCGPGRGGAVCICDSSFGSIIATIDVLHPVSSLAVIDGGASPGSRLLSPAIANMCGVAAVGLTGCGYVMLVNLRRHDPDGPHTTILLNEASFKVPRLFALMGSDGKVQRFLPSYTVDVTCLQYVPCITSLLVGYNFGCFEIWDLRDHKIRYVSPVMEQTIPVAHMAFQEPLDDPSNFCYVWAVHSPSGEQNSSGACHPVAVMYGICYQWKEWVDGCGYIYEDFKECSQHYFFEMKTFENKKTLGGSSITCQAVGTAVSRQHRSLGPDDFDDSANEGELSLCLFAWQTIDTDCKSLLRVALFDLDRWYKEQMPQSGNGSYIVVFHLEDTLRALTNPVLDVVVDESSLQPYHSDTGHEEDYRPSALSFVSQILFEEELVEINHPGKQQFLLSHLDKLCPLDLLHPPLVFKHFCRIGLRPALFDIPRSSSEISMDQQRRFLLALAVEWQMSGFLHSCAVTWASLSRSAPGCSLPALLAFSWEFALAVKDEASKLCAPLFDHSGTKLDRAGWCKLSKYCKQLCLLAELFRGVLTSNKIPKISVPDCVEKQAKDVEMISLYFEVVQWFMNAGLLPEFPDDGVSYGGDLLMEDHHKLLPYPASVIKKFYEDRRADEVPLFVDLLLEQDKSQKLKQLWVVDGGSGYYPPPSLQALLQAYLIDVLDTTAKHRFVIFFLLDLAETLDDRYAGAINYLIKFSAAFHMGPSTIKITQAMWLLDHKDFEEALRMLLDPMIRPSDVEQWQHRAIALAFLKQGKANLALDYIVCRNVSLDTFEDVRLKISILIENKKVLEAYVCQSLYSVGESNQELMEFFLCELHRAELLNHIFYLTLTPTEEKCFFQFLEKYRIRHAGRTKVIYYLQHCSNLDRKKSIMGVSPKKPLYSLALRKNSKVEERRPPLRFFLKPSSAARDPETSLSKTVSSAKKVPRVLSFSPSPQKRDSANREENCGSRVAPIKAKYLFSPSMLAILFPPKQKETVARRPGDTASPFFFFPKPSSAARDAETSLSKTDSPAKIVPRVLSFSPSPQKRDSANREENCGSRVAPIKVKYLFSPSMLAILFPPKQEVVGSNSEDSSGDRNISPEVAGSGSKDSRRDVSASTKLAECQSVDDHTVKEQCVKTDNPPRASLISPRITKRKSYRKTDVSVLTDHTKYGVGSSKLPNSPSNDLVQISTWAIDDNSPQTSHGTTNIEKSYVCDSFEAEANTISVIANKKSIVSFSHSTTSTKVHSRRTVETLSVAGQKTEDDKTITAGVPSHLETHSSFSHVAVKQAGNTNNKADKDSSKLFGTFLSENAARITPGKTSSRQADERRESPENAKQTEKTVFLPFEDAVVSDKSSLIGIGKKKEEGKSSMSERARCLLPDAAIHNRRDEIVYTEQLGVGVSTAGILKGSKRCVSFNATDSPKFDKSSVSLADVEGEAAGNENSVQKKSRSRLITSFFPKSSSYHNPSGSSSSGQSARHPGDTGERAVREPPAVTRPTLDKASAGSTPGSTQSEDLHKSETGGDIIPTFKKTCNTPVSSFLLNTTSYLPDTTAWNTPSDVSYPRYLKKESQSVDNTKSSESSVLEETIESDESTSLENIKMEGNVSVPALTSRTGIAAETGGHVSATPENVSNFLLDTTSYLPDTTAWNTPSDESYRRYLKKESQSVDNTKSSESVSMSGEETLETSSENVETGVHVSDISCSPTRIRAETGGHISSTPKNNVSSYLLDTTSFLPDDTRWISPTNSPCTSHPENEPQSAADINMSDSSGERDPVEDRLPSEPRETGKSADRNEAEHSATAEVVSEHRRNNVVDCAPKAVKQDVSDLPELPDGSVGDDRRESIRKEWMNKPVLTRAGYRRLCSIQSEPPQMDDVADIVSQPRTRRKKTSSVIMESISWKRRDKYKSHPEESARVTAARSVAESAEHEQQVEEYTTELPLTRYQRSLLARSADLAGERRVSRARQLQPLPEESEQSKRSPVAKKTSPRSKKQESTRISPRKGMRLRSRLLK